MSTPLRTFVVAMAMREEDSGVLTGAGVSVLFTGLGKVNAATALARHLVALRIAGTPPGLVVNFGTAGSPRFRTGEMVACRRFVQRDIDLTPLGFPRGHTPFDEHGGVLEFDPVFPHLREATCGTGDSFETAAAGVDCDVVDMEAYALAKVCRHEGVPFACAKFISDGADTDAARDWRANVALAAPRFLELLHHLAARL
jgi:adenosylhomocysteine nucleosidase